jgi:hypothetical protein
MQAKFLAGTVTSGENRRAYYVSAANYHPGVHGAKGG